MSGESRAPAIGIDLGTTYSCAAVWRHDRVEIIPNDQGNRITPSCVSFTEHERLVGDSAMNAAASNPVNTMQRDSLVGDSVILWSSKIRCFGLSRLFRVKTTSHIPRAPRMGQRFDVCFDIDADGILNVSAVIRATGKKSSLKISSALPRKDEIKRLLEDAERCKSEDERHRQRFVVWNSLRDYVYDTRNIILTGGKRSPSSELPARDVKRIRDEINSSIEWLDANESAEADVLVKKRIELESNWNPFITEASQQ